MEIKSISWIGSKGNKIELRAYCETNMEDKTVNLDGDIFPAGKKPFTHANLDLVVDGKLVDNCWNIASWEIIDAGNGLKKVWGLRVAMKKDQAKIVEKFLNDIIESGKSDEVKAYETKQHEIEKEKLMIEAKSVIEKAAKYTEPLMTKSEYRIWAKHYNDINNEGGEGYIPERITVERYEWAKNILAE